LLPEARFRPWAGASIEQPVKGNVEFFISRASADAAFAAVVGEILTEAGHGVVLQQWDFANRNFMERMHAALADGTRVVALLSPEYLRSAHCQAEWQNAIASDPLNTESRLIVLRVAECEPVGLLSGLAYWDLVPVADNRSLLRDIVLDAVRKDRERAASGPYWRAPRSILDGEAVRPVPGFSGREPELTTLASNLSRDGAITVVQGLGGVGKSAVAREFAWRNREEYSVIWWLNAETEDGIVEGLLRLGSLFVRGLDRHADRRAAAQQVINSMLGGFAKPVLLVFDNLDDERLLHAWRPRTGSRVLATSRNAAWGADVAVVPLQTWELDTAIGYLQRESARSDVTEADAREIAEALGALPLALAHAAASLRGMRMVTPGRYLERIGQHLKNAPRGAEYPQSVFATFTTAIAQAEKEAAGAAAVLCFAASFAPDAIPDEIFRQSAECYCAEMRDAITDEVRLDEALGALDRLSLLAFSEASRTYSVHRLVQLAALDTIDDTVAWQECAVAVADAAFPEAEFKSWPQCERLLPHARAALDVLPEDTAFLPAARLAHKCAVYLRERGDYVTSETLAKRELRILERTHSADHPEVAAGIDELALTYYRQGRYDEANQLQKRALAIREKAYGDDHLETAKSLHRLANIAYEQGRYDEAEPLHKRALVIREKVFGAEHPDIARSLNDLANLAHERGRYDEAVSLYIRALAIFEKTLDSDHPLVPTLLNNLATSYEWQGRYAEAESVHTRARTMLEKSLGPDHPTVATSLHNLAIVYMLQERYDQAVSLYTRALDIRERRLGSEHPDVARTLHELSIVYHRQGRYDEAEPLQKRALAMREKVFGPAHYEVAMSLHDLANLREALGHFEEAEKLHKRAISIRESALRPDHPDVAISLSGLANLYAQRARYEEAIPLYVRALAIRENALGSDHVLTNAVREALKRVNPSE
jgi:tetratricopeptide (TPR) repeat protein